jgi:hypothetical protein
LTTWRSYPNQLELSARERASWRRKLNYCRVVIVEGETLVEFTPGQNGRDLVFVALFTQK